MFSGCDDEGNKIERIDLLFGFGTKIEFGGR